MEAVTNTLISWLANGPPRQNERELAGIRFYEASVGDRVVLGYAVKEHSSVRSALGPNQTRLASIVKLPFRSQWS